MTDPRLMATLDLGSNSFHMLIAREDQGRIHRIDTLKEPVRLGMGLQMDGILDQASQERALRCLTRFAQRLRGVRTENVRVVGTNTLRRAANVAEFLKKIEKVLPVPVEVIGGSEEARLIYLGVATYLSRSEERNLVIDIGGGSTEFIIGRNTEPKVRESRPLGCVSFTQRFFPNGQITRKRFDRALIQVGQQMEPYLRTFAPSNWERAVGASGTIKAVGGILKAMGVSHGAITAEGLEALLNLMPWGKKLNQKDLPGLREDRVPVFAGGFAVLYGIFRALGIMRMQVSPYSLREGVLLDLIGRGHDQDKRLETVARLKKFFGVDVAQVERVRRTAISCFDLLSGVSFERPVQLRATLSWAAELHEMGIALAHTGYHKLGAYLIMNSDLDGFSQTEQALLGFLVLNHRKRIKTESLPYEAETSLILTLLLRLACIFNRERTHLEMPDLMLAVKEKAIDLKVPRKWLSRHPLTHYDLEIEQDYWRRIGYTFALNGDTL